MGVDCERKEKALSEMGAVGAFVLNIEKPYSEA
jgi:hypothetical protein